MQGLDYLERGQHERRVLVVVADGADNASRATLSEAIARARASNAVIYTVALVDPVDDKADPGLLRRIAQLTGGQSFVPRDAEAIHDILQRIAQDIFRADVMIGGQNDDARERIPRCNMKG